MVDVASLPPGDIDILRRLAARKAEIAQLPENLERKRLWYEHDRGTGGRPMILAEAFGQGMFEEIFPKDHLKCEDGWARFVEGGLRFDIYQFEELKDDHVVEPYHNVPWSIHVSDYGVQVVEYDTDNSGKLAAKKWGSPISDLDRDFHKLRPRTYSVDRQATASNKETFERLFGNILTVRIRGMFGGLPWSMGMTETAMKLHGLENLMLNTVAHPEGLHRLMAFLCDEHIAYAEWLEEEGLLTLNNENDYMGSGSMAYSRDLPRSGADPDEPLKTKDIWVLVESQETVGIGPTQFEEVFFPYQQKIAEKFGKCYYGCCEPVHNRWHVLKRISNLARVSVSPWADQEFMAAELGTDVVYSRKPNPVQVSTMSFDEDAIRADLRKTVDIAGECRLEIVMKDVHTVNGDPRRLPRWVEIAREEVDRAG
jgi:hypothetical protein